MNRHTLRFALAGAVLAAMAFGCGKKQEAIDVAAPPPSQPASQPETSPYKARPMAPPVMGGGPQQKR